MSEDHLSDRLLVSALVLAWWGVIFPIVALVWPAASAPYERVTTWLVVGFAGLLLLVTVFELAAVRRVPDHEARLARKRGEGDWGRQFLSGELVDPRLLLINRVSLAGLFLLPLLFDLPHGGLLLASFAISTLMMLLELKNRFLAD